MSDGKIEPVDGTHAAVKWRDELDSEPVGEPLPEEVY